MRARRDGKKKNAPYAAAEVLSAVTRTGHENKDAGEHVDDKGGEEAEP